MDMCYDSIQEFLSQTLIIIPYLSDEALDILEVNGLDQDEEWKKYDIDISELTNDTKINAVVKEHLNLINSEFELKKSIIMQALTYDIKSFIVFDKKSCVKNCIKNCLIQLEIKSTKCYSINIKGATAHKVVSLPVCLKAYL